MAIQQAGQTFYSFQELASILKTEPENITKFVTQTKFSGISEINGNRFVGEQYLSEFFSSYVSASKIKGNFYQIPEALSNSSDPWAITLAEMYRHEFAYPFTVSPSQGQQLKDLICDINPSTSLEIGCFIGISTIWLAAGLEQLKGNGFIHSVDLFNPILPWPPHSYGYLQDPLKFTQQSAVAANLVHRIKFHKMPSSELGKRFTEVIGKPIDFLFIDGDHSIHGCLNDFVLFYPQVSLGGYILLHDIHPEYSGWDGPRYLIDNFVKNSPHFSLVEIDTSPHNFGIAVIRKLSEDKYLHPGANVKIEFHRTKGMLARTQLWSHIRNSQLGKLIKKIACQIT